MVEVESPFRLLISSTPKTGNTWLYHLLASLYDLRKVGLVVPFDRKQAERLGNRWVAFHHMRPQPELLEWIAATRPILLTTVRHPGDVLISLYHHIHGFEKSGEDPVVMRDMLHFPFDRNLIEPFERTTLADELSISIGWLRAGARMVRYEDLWRDPVGALNDLTSLLGPVSQERIERAVEKCDFDLMRKMAGEHGRFFRAGRVGDWRHTLTSEILADLANEPYRGQMLELGYTLDPADPIIAAPAKPRPQINPFRDSPRFDNGVAVAPIIADCYLAQDSAITQQWGNPTSTGPGSYYEWLNARSGLEGDGIYAALPVSNLANYAYENRGDVKFAYPRIANPDRVGFVSWFARQAPAEFELDPVFVEQIRRDLPAWANSLAPAGGPAQPQLTHLALHLREMYTGLRDAFPDLAGDDAARYAEWFVRRGESELELGAEQIEPVKAALLTWGTARSPDDGEDHPWWPAVSNFALRVYRSRPDAQDAFPDVFGLNRWGYLTWLDEMASELDIYPGFAGVLRADLESRRPPGEAAISTCDVIEEVYRSCSPDFRGSAESFFQWLNDPLELGGRDMYSGLRISNLAYYIYRNRRDLIDAFPDLTGPDGANYAEWFVRNGKSEFHLEEAFLEPVRAGLLAWGNARSERDLVTRFWWPHLTNFALHLYNSRPDAQQAFPDLLNQDRWNFLQWTVDHAGELNLYPALADPIRAELTRVRSIRKLGTDWPFRLVKRYLRRDSRQSESPPSPFKLTG